MAQCVNYMLRPTSEPLGTEQTSVVAGNKVADSLTEARHPRTKFTLCIRWWYM